MKTIHFKHLEWISVGRDRGVMSCTGEVPFDKSLALTDKIDKVTCRECFFIYYHSEIICCGGNGPETYYETNR